MDGWDVDVAQLRGTQLINLDTVSPSLYLFFTYCYKSDLTNTKLFCIVSIISFNEISQGGSFWTNEISFQDAVPLRLNFLWNSNMQSFYLESIKHRYVGSVWSYIHEFLKMSSSEMSHRKCKHSVSNVGKTTFLIFSFPNNIHFHINFSPCCIQIVYNLPNQTKVNLNVF